MIRSIQHPDNEIECSGWQLDITERELVDPIAGVILLYNGQTKALLGTDGTMVVLNNRNRK